MGGACNNMGGDKMHRIHFIRKAGNKEPRFIISEFKFELQ
jgi:hypothetical protein